MSKQDYKVVILGASGVGKTCLGLRFVKDQFVNYTASTIGAAGGTYVIGTTSSATRWYSAITGSAIGSSSTLGSYAALREMS